MCLFKVKNRDSLFTNDTYGGRKWNKFKGMYEAYPIRTKGVDFMTRELEKIVDREVQGVGLYMGKSKYDGHFGFSLHKKD